MSEIAGVEWISGLEGAKLLGISPATFYRMVMRREVVAYRVGKRWRFKREDVLAAIKRVDVDPK